MAAPNRGGLNDLEDIPKPWRHALAAVQVCCPDSMIAGGCLRDRDHGVKVKDIDIFVSSRSNESYHQVENVLKDLRRGGWKDAQVDDEKTYTSTDRYISGLINARFPGAPPIQIIVGTFDIGKVLDEIDFGICQIGYDGRRIMRTRWYNDGASAHEFRLIPKVNDEGFIRSINRWARLKEKYPEWKLHLGSRAEQASGGWVDVSSRPDIVNVQGVVSQKAARLLSKQVMLQALGNREFVVPKAAAERLARELRSGVILHQHVQHPDKFAIEVRDPNDRPKALSLLNEIVKEREVMMDAVRRRALSSPAGSTGILSKSTTVPI
jgi:hypothetical protein